MMKTLLSALLLQAAVPNDGAPPAAATLPPLGNWVVDGSESQCMLSHDFGNGRTKVTLGIRPGLLGESFEVFLLAPKSAHERTHGTATIGLSPDRRRWMQVPFRRQALNETHSVSVLKGYGGADWWFAGASRVRVDLAGALIDLAPPQIDPALAALRKCHDTLLAHWGVTKAEQELIGPLERKDIEYAIGNPATWVTFSDYPRDALAARQQGEATIIWTIGLDGRARDCRVVKSSGVPSIDATACAVITKRARYRPIHDKAGKPMELHAARAVSFFIP